MAHSQPPPQQQQHQQLQEQDVDLLMTELAVDVTRRERLVQATRAGDVPTVAALLELDHSLLHHTLNRKTSLLVLAVENGHYGMSEFLLKRGIDANKVCHARRTAIHRAAALPEALALPLLHLLVLHGARLNPPCNSYAFGWLSPLHTAVEKRRVGNVRALVELGSDVKGRDGRHMTPLDLCGRQSGIAKAIKEGLGMRWIRETMRKLLVLSVLMGREEGRKGKRGGSGGGDCVKVSEEEGEAGVKERGETEIVDSKKIRKTTKNESLSWRERRQRKGKPMPFLRFCVGSFKEDEEEEGEGVKYGRALERPNEDDHLDLKRMKQQDDEEENFEGRRRRRGRMTSLNKKEKGHIRDKRVVMSLKAPPPPLQPPAAAAAAAAAATTVAAAQAAGAVRLYKGTMVQPVVEAGIRQHTIHVYERAALGVNAEGRICYFLKDEGQGEEKEKDDKNEEEQQDENGTLSSEKTGSRSYSSSSSPPVPLSVIHLPLHHFLLPGLIDTHIHAPQFSYTGTATHLPLMSWLSCYTFPAEERLKDDLPYAKALYSSLLSTVVAHGTTTALYFATKDIEPTKLLADLAHTKGQRAYIGKINMDRNAPPSYCETSAASSLEETEKFIKYVKEKINSPLVHPALTPRFLPTCSEPLLRGLGELVKKYGGEEEKGGREGGRARKGIHVQSHISESADHIEFNKSLAEHHEGTQRDVEVFDRCGLLTPLTVLAHGIHLSPHELSLLSSRGTSLAHCPLSNFFFGHSVLPTRTVLEAQVKVGLGTDVAGGYSPSMLSAVRSCVIASRVLEDGVEEWRHGEEVDEEGEKIKCERQEKIQNEGMAEGGKEMWCKSGRDGMRIDWKEALWLATMGGAGCLGLEDEVGSFEVGKAFDAVRIDVKKGGGVVVVEGGRDSAEDLVQKWVNCGDDRHVIEVWVAGREIKKVNQQEK